MLLGNSVKQLYRAPVRSLVWVLALALACGMVCIGVGMYVNTQRSVAVLRDSFITIAEITDVQNREIAVNTGHREGLDTNEIYQRMEENRKASFAALAEAADNSGYASRNRTELFGGYMPGVRTLTSGIWNSVTGFDSPYVRCMLVISCREVMGEKVVSVEEKPLLHRSFSNLYNRIEVLDSFWQPITLEVGHSYLLLGVLYYGGTGYPSTISVMRENDGQDCCYDTEGMDTDTVLAQHPDARALSEQIRINLQSVDVLTCDRVMGIPCFNTGEKNIIEGRSFTEMEADNGAFVCLLSGNLAVGNGIKVGDTVTLTVYEDVIAQYNGGIIPLWYRIGTKLPEPEAQALTYEVVGLYSTPNWESRTSNFSPNTVIVPYSTLNRTSKLGELGILSSWIIENDALADFTAAMEPAEAVCTSMFTFRDQGYGEVQDMFLSMEYNAGVMLAMSLVCWVAVTALFLILWLLRSRREMGMMRSLGTGGGYAIGQVLAGCMVLVIAGAVTGALVGMTLYGSAMNAMLQLSYQQVAETLRFSDAPSAVAHVLETAGSGSPAVVWLAVPPALLLTAAFCWLGSLLQSRTNPRVLMQSEV